MAAAVYANNAASTLAAGINASQTTLTVASGQGALFPSPSGGDWFPLTVEAGDDLEITHCTARSGDVLTVARAQEGTAALAFAAGAKAELRLTAGALAGYLPRTAAVNSQTGASHTLALADAGGIVEMDNAGANTLTVPPDSAVPFPVGAWVEVVQAGAGQTTIAAGAGVTLRAGPGLAVAERWTGATLYKRGTNEWVAMGNLS